MIRITLEFIYMNIGSVLDSQKLLFEAREKSSVLLGDCAIHPTGLRLAVV